MSGTSTGGWPRGRRRGTSSSARHGDRPAPAREAREGRAGRADMRRLWSWALTGLAPWLSPGAAAPPGGGGGGGRGGDASHGGRVGAGDRAHDAAVLGRRDRGLGPRDPVAREPGEAAPVGQGTRPTAAQLTVTLLRPGAGSRSLRAGAAGQGVRVGGTPSPT